MKIAQYVSSVFGSTRRVKPEEPLPVVNTKAKKTTLTAKQSKSSSSLPPQPAKAVPSPVRAPSSRRARPSDAAAQKRVRTPPSMNDAEQQKVLEGACRFLLQVNRSRPTYFAGLTDLSRCTFAAEKNNTKLLLEGLCHFFAHDYAKCIEALSILLQKDPTNRSALVYRFLAANLSIMSLKAEKVAEITLHLRYNFCPEKEDIVARLVFLHSLNQMKDWRRIESDLKTLDRDKPQDVRILSCLAVNSLQAYVFHGDLQKKHDARDFSYCALQVDPTDTFAFSTLWHSTQGLGYGTFSPLYGMKSDCGSYRTVLHCSDCTLKAVRSYTITNLDPFLSKEIQHYLQQ